VIFVTVGAQLPFDRLVHTVDQWAQRSGRDDVLAQIGPTDHVPQHIEWVEMLDPIEYRNRFWEADVIIAHAGAGTIITAMEMSKPLLVMPRRAPQETRNNHQFATVKFLAQKFGIPVAYEEPEIPIRLESLLGSEEVDAASHQLGQFAEPQLLDFVRLQIELAGKDQSRLLV